MTAMADTPAISRDDVAHLARLARIDLPEDSLDHYAEQLGVILGAVAQVSEVAADDVPATSHPMPLVNVFRDDVVRPSLTNAEALSGAPSVEDERFRVPRILDEE
jgi:aspartyl-tRNA(Asn)/glutamyl-tRNA(Gln) amidotransferase subunit C